MLVLEYSEHLTLNKRVCSQHKLNVSLYSSITYMLVVSVVLAIKMRQETMNMLMQPSYI